MPNRIVLTADRTLMSAYNGSMFIGFAACFPRVLPKWLYTKIFCPAPPHDNGRARSTPAGLRKIEAALVNSGIPGEDVFVAHPERLGSAITADTKAIGITTSDPLGLGPASSTFSSLLRREPYTAFYFRQLLKNPAIRKSRAKVIVGGPGAWQLANDDLRERLGIDTLVEGEGELVSPQLFKDALDDKELPRHVTGGVVPVDGIPSILAPTINGTVEISRGCGRGCEFCNPNMRQVRHIPKDRILREVRVNLAVNPRITLHAEDVLRYGARGMVPDRNRVLDLFVDVLRLTDRVGISHFALSSALAEPKLIEGLSEAFGAGNNGTRIYGQTGIETGSPRLVSMHMRGKAKPFEPERWPQVVRESIQLLNDNHWVPCGTLVMGIPGERAEDVSQTVELVADLRDLKCLIVPLFFVPLGELKEDEFFRPKAMLPEHWTLLAECIEHDFKWASVLMDELFAQNRLKATKAAGLKLTAWYMRRKLKPYVDLMKEGKSPLEHGDELGEEDTGPCSEEGSDQATA
jgi:radical SAM superfamily enzyme YgiQ (UPF0313 family)